ncbi:MAG: hypothetical protein WDZ94_03090 [Patescibacteria group bacterium]
MKKTTGYTITEQDIETTLKYLCSTVDESSSREDAIAFLEEHKSMAHVAAHKIVEDENE